jgi:PKD repeat protein
VVADFSFSPPNPFHNQQITFDASSSRPVGGNLSFAWTVESAGHSYTGCPAAMICTIPAESLNPDATYDVTLSVTNNDDSAVSEITKAVAVANGAFQPTITFLPADPGISESVIFTIEGVPVHIDKASWRMGALGCSGADSTPECISGLWTDCKAQAYTYAVSGTWTVNVSVEIDGEVFNAVPATITVSDSGYCDADFSIFLNGFESGSMSAWSSAKSGAAP